MSIFRRILGLIVMIAGILAETGWMFVYARNLAQMTAISRQLVPVRSTPKSSALSPSKSRP